MKLVILLFILFSVSQAFAGDLVIDWVCPKNSSEKTPVTVSFNGQGKLQFKPDIFTGSYKSGDVEELSGCIADFQKKVSDALKSHKASNCSASKDSLCVISQDYLNSKVFEKLQGSKLVKKTPGLKVERIPEEVLTEKKTNDSSINEANNASEKPKETISEAATAEDFLREKIAKKEIDPKNLNQTFEYKKKAYKVSDFDNVVGENIQNVFSEMGQDEAKQFAQNYMVAKADVIKATEPSERRTAVLNNLNQMYGKIYGSKGPEELAKILECKPEDELKPISDILENLEDTKKVEKCKSLEPGEHKVFKKDHANYYGTGRYLLKRTKEGSYQAVLNVKFKTGGGSVSPEAMLARAKECLNTASLALKGPNGEKLQLSVLSPEEADKLPDDEQPEKNEVSIEPVGYGTNSGAYAEDSQCPTITHEMLHLLGLCDEYLEDRPQYGNMWNCRVVTKVPSIMRNHVQAFNDAIPRTHTCECSQPPCSAIMKSNNEDIKKLFMGEGQYDAIPYEFRNKYCSEKYVKAGALTEPSKSLVIKSQAENFITIESRMVMSQTKAPQYQIHKSEVTCRCLPGNQECADGLKEIAERVSAPKIKNSCPYPTKPSGSSVAGKKVDGFKFDEGVLTMASDATLPSLLQPQQFNKILAGACPGKGADAYNECADFAYKSDSSGPCNVPERCRDDKYFMGSKQ